MSYSSPFPFGTAELEDGQYFSLLKERGLLRHAAATFLLVRLNWKTDHVLLC